jgi:hypothetical protein
VRARESIAICALAVCALLGQPAAALAQAPAQRADALFKEGRKLFDERKYDLACPKLAESDSIDPNINAIGLLAACHEEQGRLATAWQEYLETAKRARAAGDKREAFASERAAALEPKVPRVTLLVKQPEPNLEVTRNGAPVPESEIGEPVPIDPGTVEIVVTAPDKLPWRASVTVAPGARQTIEIPALAEDKSNPFVGPPPPETPGPPTPPLRIAGFIAGGIGLVGLGVGAGFGIAAIGKNNDAGDAGCVDANCPPGDATDLRNDARSLAMGSNIGFGIGIAGVGAGVVLLILSSGSQSPAPPEGAAPVSVRVAPALGPAVAGAVVRGTF